MVWIIIIMFLKLYSMEVNMVQALEYPMRTSSVDPIFPDAHEAVIPWCMALSSFKRCNQIPRKGLRHRPEMFPHTCYRSFYQTNTKYYATIRAFLLQTNQRGAKIVFGKMHRRMQDQNLILSCLYDNYGQTNLLVSQL